MKRLMLTQHKSYCFVVQKKIVYTINQAMLATVKLSNNKNWLAPNQNNVSEWSDMFIRRLFFQWASTINIQLSVLV
jgi:hypothetical protein